MVRWGEARLPGRSLHSRGTFPFIQPIWPVGDPSAKHSCLLPPPALEAHTRTL